MARKGGLRLYLLFDETSYLNAAKQADIFGRFDYSTASSRSART
jgi:hypothetical protein